jgi:hypothetical protein
LVGDTVKKEVPSFEFRVSSWKINRAHKSESGLSLVELVAILTIILLIALVGTRYLVHRKKVAARAQCVNNLKNVGLAFRIYSTDSSPDFATKRLLTAGVALESIDAVLVLGLHSNELSTPKYLHCPADRTRATAADFRKFSARNISYFASLMAADNMPDTILSGDRNLETNGAALRAGLFAMLTNTAIGWTEEMHVHKGNVGLGDGSVQQFDSNRLRMALSRQEVGTNWLTIP